MNYKILFTCFLGLLLSCATPQKSFEKGNYKKAYATSLKKVKNRKANSSDKRILLESLRRIVEENMAFINANEHSDSPRDLKETLKMINSTQSKINEVKQYTKIEFDESLLELDDKEAEITDVLYNHFFNGGLYLLKEAKNGGQKVSAQEAYARFVEAEEYRPSNELDSLKKVAVETGLMKYQVNADAPFAMTFDWEIDRVFGEIERESHLFLEVNYDRFGSDADCQIEVEFRNLEIFETRNITNQMEFQEEVILRYETVTDTSGTREIPVRGTVYATLRVTEFTKSVITDVDIDIDSNSSDCNLRGNSFSRRFDAVVQENEITGDERAVPSQYRRYESREDLPRDNELVEELIREVYGEFLNLYF